MRAIRLVFIVILAIVLILVATANRAPITIGLLPQNIAEFTGRDWALTMPGFLALFLAMVFGVLVGLVWEWLREAHLRAESKTRAHHLARLEREMGDLRRTHAASKDEVLAILDDTPARKPATPATGGALPAPR
ncbi:hypothetical protein SAMN04487972_103108 [Paracoccus halophilus]|uniref:Lipopolysaccharide assembly protein A domain-containing protein n=1 Tax=Paracoccus halophilus TaxID=376733 RepID=A0A099F4T7_9RHOB|nr:LapA family protein [Paracoccus halophilus]KGJ05157.1 hypothetical protein IT41_07160 [Paracoccus halophilus]SFA43835.1 hypothetical protein SAMN04487972_103108 [Paracoccus halophilus]